MAHFGTTPAPQPSFERGSNKPPVPQAWTKPERVNAYGARCVKCTVWVEPGAGRLTNRAGQWEVSHIPPCPERQPVVETVTVTEVPEATKVSETPAFSVPDGRYTVIFADDYKTIRVSHQDADSTFMPGRTILGYLSVTDNDRDYTSFAHVDESGSVRIWKKHQGVASLSESVKVLLGDPKAASKAYAAESGCCGICGRTLTTPESIERGIGPTCAEKTGW
jgi:hypothetical protein